MFRRLIKAGPSSLAASLPVDWIKRNGLKAGSEIRIQESQNSLTISAQAESADGNIKLAYDDLLIDSMLDKLFWEKYNKIIIYDEKPLPQKIKSKLTNLPGFEIIEESEKEIIIERILEASVKNSKGIVNRCYYLIKSALESNPPKFHNDLQPLLITARLYSQESKEMDALLQFIDCLKEINSRMHDDTHMRLKTTYDAIYEQKFSFQRSKAKDLSKMFEETDSIFVDYFKNSNQILILAKAHHGFLILKELNKEITKKQSIEILTKLEHKKNQKTYNIGICLKNQSNTFWGTEVPSGMRQALSKISNIDLEINYPLTDFNIKQQEEILKKFIKDEMDVIIYAPIDPNAMEKTLSDINKKGIPLIVLDTELALPKIKHKHIGFDNYEGGKMTAEYLLKKITDKKNIVILEGHLKGNFSQRAKGFADKAGDAKILTGDFTGSTAYEQIKEHAKKNKISAIFAASDNMALGAAQAIRELKIKVPVCGFDATKEGQKAVKDKVILSTINTHPEKLGELAIQTAQDILAKKTVPDRIEYDIELIS